MSTDADKQALIMKYFPDPEQRLSLDYVAKAAAREAIDTYAQKVVYTLAGKAAIGMLAVMVAVGAIIWGVVEAALKR
jgi:hypothetical protein